MTTPPSTKPAPQPAPHMAPHTAEEARLAEDAARTANWKRWGPYLSERQWGTVREDYSADGDCWNSFPHDQARSRAYRWGEDGLLGITDRECRLCFALALWNGHDPILKERLFGLTGPEGNHGEDVKEHYFYLDSTPTHSYMKALYKYPHGAYPYDRLVAENHRRSRAEPEFELTDTGVFDGGRFFEVTAEYAKAAPDDVLIRITIENRGPESAPLHVLPTLWFRNTWSWGAEHEESKSRPSLRLTAPGVVRASHDTLGDFEWIIAQDAPSRLLFTENDTNTQRIFGTPNPSPYVKDAFHHAVIHRDDAAVNPAPTGTKAAAWFNLTVPGGGTITLKLRLRPASREAGAVTIGALDADFDRLFAQRLAEADEFFAKKSSSNLTPDEHLVSRQAYAGLLWSKQFYHYIVGEWLDGDPAQPVPPVARLTGRNAEWRHLHNRDVISMPDKWEYPWYAAWDLAFHMIPMAHVDPDFAKQQLLLFLREWYMHPSGQLPAYEFALGDVNPPVHAWACWRVYKKTGPRGRRDRLFLARCFHKLLLNFTWWVNRKDPAGKNLFSGGFLGLDNIGVFDRSRPLPTGGHLEQADGTAWMAFYCGTMLSMALELAGEDPAYEDVASKFFEHFIAITDAMNTMGGTGLWNEEDGFYYDQLNLDGAVTPLRVRSLVGLIPIIAVEILDDDLVDRLPGFRKRLDWFLRHRADLARHISYMNSLPEDADRHHHLLAIPSRDRLTRVLRYLTDEAEFLSPFGIRSLSKIHADYPYVVSVGDEEFSVEYAPGESNTSLFGGNSNWRGPIWLPINFLLIEALERYHHFYGDSFTVEYPFGSGVRKTLGDISDDLRRRLTSLFLPGPSGARPSTADDSFLCTSPDAKNLILFHEHFHAETGRGLGASHQTGWTALIARLMGDAHTEWKAAPRP